MYHQSKIMSGTEANIIAFDGEGEPSQTNSWLNVKDLCKEAKQNDVEPLKNVTWGVFSSKALVLPPGSYGGFNATTGKTESEDERSEMLKAVQQTVKVNDLKEKLKAQENTIRRCRMTSGASND